jgi:5-methylcytosine-specific restriction endonuclease McrA
VIRESRNAWSRQRACCDCGKVESVRKDNPAERCKTCAARKSGAIGLATIKARAKPRERRQRKAGERVERQCRMCGRAFSVLCSVLRTNATGNFCSRPCYDQWMRQTPIEGRRGRGWKAIAREVIRKAPFCARCGSIKRRLHVHHLAPYRITRDNDPENLIPLCNGCHTRVEAATKTVEAAGGDPEVIFLSLRAILRIRQAATAELLRKLWREQSGSRDVADRPAD